MAESGEEQQQPELQPQQPVVKECMHKTKTIQVFGRTTPIILQNENGPCPLLAICNVLLLKDNLKLSPDIGEVSQEKLLQLVAERVIDSNSNVNMQNRDAGYVENQQKNISDAIDLLPRLATGIDVNIKFRRIDDFEFTPECAIFDLLDIPLYHGWIVDPQDCDTANAIGSKSYNALMGELVALESMGGESKSNSEEDCVDFAAATTAALGVPSPCLSKTRSFDDSPHAVPDQPKLRKGDLEEEEQLLRALKMSATVATSFGDSPVAGANRAIVSVNSDESTCSNKIVPSDAVHTVEGHTGVENQSFHKTEPSILDNINALSDDSNNNLASFKNVAGEDACSSQMTDGVIKFDQSSKTETLEHICCNDLIEKTGVKMLVQVEDAVFLYPRKDTASVETHVDISQGGEKLENQLTTTTDLHERSNNLSGFSTTELACLSVPNADSDSSSGTIQHTAVPETFTSSVDGSEPIYEGEECILDSGTTAYEEREPVYEGEVILVKQGDKSSPDAHNVRSKDEITPQKGELIKNFLKNNASQLTINGLFCLRDGLKEGELCVFFWNNHFSTMYKHDDGELYLLATDQGYINQPDLVWQKLNEVNGDTLFMTGSFKEFKVESHANDPWDEHVAMASTADFLASIDSAQQAGLDMNSDLQLAIALQQQEFEQQPQRSNSQPPPATGSRLITGPQVPRNVGRSSTSSSSKPDAKSKDRCSIM